MHYYFRRIIDNNGKKSLEYIGDDTIVTGIDKADPFVFKAHDIHISVEQIKEYQKCLDTVCYFVQSNPHRDSEQMKIHDNMWHAVHAIEYEWDIIAQSLQNQIELLNNYDWT